MKPIELGAEKNNWQLFKVMLSIGFICAISIVFAYQLTASTIKENQREFLDHAIATIYPTVHKKSKINIANQKTENIFAIYDQDDQKIGYIISAEGMGYQDSIKLLYGYSPLDESIIGIKVIASRETPGLGDRIIKDSEFLSNFTRLPMPVSQYGKLLHPLENVKSSTKKEPWQIDSISGATISSRAVVDIINKSSQQWIPTLKEIEIGN